MPCFSRQILVKPADKIIITAAKKKNECIDTQKCPYVQLNSFKLKTLRGCGAMFTDHLFVCKNTCQIWEITETLQIVNSGD